MLLGHCAWEIAENTPFVIDIFSDGMNASRYEGDSILNSLGDTVFALVGAVAFLKMPRSASILLVIVVEIIVISAIDDGFITGSLRLFGADA